MMPCRPEPLNPRAHAEASQAFVIQGRVSKNYICTWVMHLMGMEAFAAEERIAYRRSTPGRPGNAFRRAWIVNRFRLFARPAPNGRL